MFTLNQIQEASSKIKSGADFPKFVQDLKALGVVSYDAYVEDGRTNYFGKDKFLVSSNKKYDLLLVSELGSSEKIKHTIHIHQQGQTDYSTFCQQAAKAGVEKWTTDMVEMTVTYFDKKGNKLTVEPIPQV